MEAHRHLLFANSELLFPCEEGSAEASRHRRRSQTRCWGRWAAAADPRPREEPPYQRVGGPCSARSPHVVSPLRSDRAAGRDREPSRVFDPWCALCLSGDARRAHGRHSNCQQRPPAPGPARSRRGRHHGLELGRRICSRRSDHSAVSIGSGSSICRSFAARAPLVSGRTPSWTSTRAAARGQRANEEALSMSVRSQLLQRFDQLAALLPEDVLERLASALEWEEASARGVTPRRPRLWGPAGGERAGPGGWCRWPGRGCVQPPAGRGSLRSSRIR